MKCAACQRDNEDALKVCAGCGKSLKARRKRRGEEEATVMTPEMEAFAGRALRLFFLALWSLAPPLGMILGPLSVAWAVAMRGPEQPGRTLVRVAFWMGLVTGVTQWLGMALIIASGFPGR